MTRALARLALLALAVAPLACFDSPLTDAEMRAAVDEIVLEGQGQTVENEIIQITTDFTLGGAVEAAAQQLRDAIASQIPCSTLTLAGNQLTIDFGELADECEYNGHTFAGVVSIAVTYDGDRAVVDHTYEGLTNGVVTLDGTKKVTWDDASRRVVSDLDVARGDRHVHATSDRVQTLLDPDAGLAGGIGIDGTRDWDGANGPWSLEIDSVEIRWIDPVPQAGSYVLTTPAGKMVTMSFERVDDDTIDVTVIGGRRDRVFRVNTGSATVDDA